MTAVIRSIVLPFFLGCHSDSRGFFGWRLLFNAILERPADFDRFFMVSHLQSWYLKREEHPQRDGEPHDLVSSLKIGFSASSTFFLGVGV